LSVEFQGVTFAYADDGRWTTDDGRRTTDDGRRTTDDGRRTTDDGRRTTDDQSPTTEAELSQKQQGEIEMDGSSVVGRPSSDQLVLDAINFTLAPGEVLGLLGRTGSGKTTMTRLLFRLYDLNGGAIRLGGVDIRTVPLTILRQRVGIVTQEVQLFRASLRDNLTLFDDRIADEQIWTVLDDLGMGDWARRLPQGLDSEIAAGEGLSAGEAQLLAFARAFLNDPGLVILDEASSRLDPATERLIERAVDKLLQNRTAIIIAHRLATVQRADTILILERGSVREHGSRKTLLQDEHSRFSALMQVGMEEVLV
jgi:ABC-type multidrug transport system fused ATPase/permease subunit